MNLVYSLVLGIVQGFTEFLPVSSSGHLVIFQKLFNFESPGILFETVLHLGTALAIAYYYKDQILNLNKKYLILLLIGSIPAGIVGFLFKSNLESLFLSTKVVGIALIVTGILNLETDKVNGRRQKLDNFDAILIGIAQAFAIVPGLSRSGATIFAGTKNNLQKMEVARFTFLLSIPAILGANILELVTVEQTPSTNVLTYLVGFLAAFISGLFAIKFVLDLLSEKKFKYFGVYAIAAGAITILVL